MRYVFRCAACRTVKESLLRSPAPKCGLCGKDMARDYKGEAVNVDRSSLR